VKHLNVPTENRDPSRHNSYIFLDWVLLGHFGDLGGQLYSKTEDAA